MGHQLLCTLRSPKNLGDIPDCVEDFYSHIVLFKQLHFVRVVSSLAPVFDQQEPKLYAHETEFCKVPKTFFVNLFIRFAVWTVILGHLLMLAHQDWSVRYSVCKLENFIFCVSLTKTQLENVICKVWKTFFFFFAIRMAMFRVHQAFLPLQVWHHSHPSVLILPAYLLLLDQAHQDPSSQQLIFLTRILESVS